jgi:hypothetical protein
MHGLIYCLLCYILFITLFVIMSLFALNYCVRFCIYFPLNSKLIQPLQQIHYCMFLKMNTKFAFVLNYLLLHCCEYLSAYCCMVSFVACS